jgi:hypothetical protein
VTGLLEEDEASTALPADEEREVSEAFPANQEREALAAVPADEVRDTRTARPADGARETQAAVPADGLTERPDAVRERRAATVAPDGPPKASTAAPADGARKAVVPKDPEHARIAAAALAVPGVTRLTDVLGQPVHAETAPATEPALPRRHIRVELAVSPGERAVDVARAVRTAITEAARDTPSVAVLVTAVSQDTRP